MLNNQHYLELGFSKQEICRNLDQRDGADGAMDKPSCLGPVDHCVETACLQFCPIWWTYPHVPVPVEDTRCLLRLQCQRNKHHLWGKFDVGHVERHHNEGWAIPIPHPWSPSFYHLWFSVCLLNPLNPFELFQIGCRRWNFGARSVKRWSGWLTKLYQPNGLYPQLYIYICAYIYNMFVYGISPRLHGMNYGFYK